MKKLFILTLVLGAMLLTGCSVHLYSSSNASVAKTEVETLIASDILGVKEVYKLSLDRAIFSEYFIKLKGLIGKSFKNTYEFCARFVGEEDLNQFIFVTTVFIELGIFHVKNGNFLIDSSVKNPLTNSKVYSKICLINGQ